MPDRDTTSTIGSLHPPPGPGTVRAGADGDVTDALDGVHAGLDLVVGRVAELDGLGPALALVLGDVDEDLDQRLAVGDLHAHQALADQLGVGTMRQTLAVEVVHEDVEVTVLQGLAMGDLIEGLFGSGGLDEVQLMHGCS